MADVGELTPEDRAALGWAMSVRHEIVYPAVLRVRGGGAPLQVEEVSAVRADWDAAGRPAPEQHVHRTAVTFEDGTVVTGVTFLDADPYTRADGVSPAFGLYLDERWSPPWTHAHVDWPDFGVPADTDALRRDLAVLLERARGGDPVELVCWGGHGRTGTALACLAVLTGTPADDAVAWVRERYCPRAVETPEQEAFVRSFGPVG